jgi:hypothetical protein
MDIQNTINMVMKPSNEDALNKILEKQKQDPNNNNVTTSNEEAENSKMSAEIKGYDINQGIDYEKMFKSYLNTGFQATNLAKAINEINRMV